MNGNKLHVLHSEQDASVNFVEEQLAGFLAIDEHRLICEFNLVAYNPATAAQGIESAPEVVAERLAYIESRFAGKVKAVQRVGFDVKASCGMFVCKE